MSEAPKLPISFRAPWRVMTCAAGAILVALLLGYHSDWNFWWIAGGAALGVFLTLGACGGWDTRHGC